MERDDEKARYWFRSMALAGFYEKDRINDFLLLGMFFGEPVPEMMQEEAARARDNFNGEPEVLMRVYQDLLIGNRIHPSPERAQVWLTKAASENHPRANYLIARGHLTGEGRSKDEDSYIMYLRRAARLNYPLAQKELGENYRMTREDDYGLYLALVWLLRAQKNGEDATPQIQAVESRLDRLDRKAAHKEASDFDFR